MEAITKEQAVAVRKRLLTLLREERERQGKTAYFVATRGGIGITALRDLESTEKNVTFDNVIKVCHSLGLTIKFEKDED